MGANKKKGQKIRRNNIMLIFLSVLSDLEKADEKNYTGYTLEGKAIEAVQGKQTNEAPVKYIVQCLGNEGLDKIYYFQTQLVQETIKGSHLSTEDYIKDRLEAYCIEKGYPIPQLVPVSFEEDTCQPALKNTLKMVEEIKQYENMEATNVYVDITGGFRDTTMILVAVMKLLQFCKIQMKQIIYSDIKKAQIVDVTSIYDLYDIVAGVNEFTKYGRVDTLKQYFNKDNNSDQLKALIAKMNNFAESLQLCQAEAFNRDLKELQRAIKDFKADNNLQEDEKLFEILMQRVQEEYREIITEDASIPVIIKWCARKGFIQQALTLYVELIPGFLVDKKIIYPVDEEKTSNQIKDELQQRHQKYKNWKCEFIRRIKPERLEKSATMFREEIESFLEKHENIAVKKGAWKEIQKVIEDYQNINDERNHTHHAKLKKEEKTVSKAKKEIIRHMDQIIKL